MDWHLFHFDFLFSQTGGFAYSRFTNIIEMYSTVLSIY